MNIETFDTGEAHVSRHRGEDIDTGIDTALSLKPDGAGIAPAAEKLSPGGKFNGVTVKGDGSAEYIPLRNAFVSQLSSTSAWFKVASIESTAVNESATISLRVSSSYASLLPTHDGIIRVGFHSGSPVGTNVFANCRWEYINGIDPSDFVVAHNTGVSPAVCELWVRLPSLHRNYNFAVLSESRGSLQPALSGTWTLFVKPTGQTEPTLGFTQIQSRVGAFMGDFNPAVSYTVQFSDLQTFINNMSKWANRSVTIKVPPGEISTAITLDRITGSGVINLYAVDAAGNTVSAMDIETHKLLSLTVSNCTCQRINIQGFTAINTTGNSFSAIGNSGFTEFRYCNALSGVNTTTTSVGLYGEDNSGQLYMAYCTISNKYNAFYVNRAVNMIATSCTGSNNRFPVYCNLGTINLSNSTIGAINKFVVDRGGFYRDVNGIPASLINNEL